MGRRPIRPEATPPGKKTETRAIYGGRRVLTTGGAVLLPMGEHLMG